MAGDSEPAKLIVPYLQRADELQKHEPLVAYYCRLYAMDRGMKIPKSDRTKTTNSLLLSLLNQLEKDKKALTLSPDDQLHIEGFALNVFNKADKQDRAGRADLNTAKTFYAASIFFEILNQFGQVQPDLEQKQRYAAWKAADIRKAIKEGRKPVPGPPGGENDISLPSSETEREYDLEQRINPFGKPGTDTDHPHDPRNDQTVGPTYGTDSSPHVNNTASFQHPPDIRPSAYNRVASPPNVPTSPSYPANDQSHNFHQPSNDPSENPYSNLYRQQSFPQEHHQAPTSFPQDHRQSQPFPQEHHQVPTHFPQEHHQSPTPFPQEQHQLPTHFPQEHHQPPTQYPQEHHQPPTQFPSQETPLYLYPNFQSYPIVPETSLPPYTSSPSSQQYPSYQQGPESGYPTAPPAAAAAAKYAPPSPPPPPQPSNEYESIGRNGSDAEANPPPVVTAKAFHYDSNYLPSPEKIVEAHKAARFAVGALAFDDVPTAVEHLRRSLELLTNPSAAGGH